MDAAAKKFTIVGDSRTKLFTKLLKGYTLPSNIHVSVHTYPGASIIDVVRRFLHRTDLDSDYVILVAGVNNLTRLEWSYDGSRRIARPVFDNTPELVESLTDSFTDAKLLRTDAGFHCIICELTGLDVNIYNKGVTNYHKHQDIIDEAIPILTRKCSVRAGRIPLLQRK